ncbi:MAG: hypothetical protein HOP19_22690, partial [Acidobacteria bacterium]|nr:hypothetical protein [Acidobacteriota bacterium]
MNAFSRLHTYRATVLTLLGLFFVSAMLYGSQVRAEAQWSLTGFGQAAWTYSSQTVSSLFHGTNAGYTPASPNPVSAPMLAPVPPAGCTLTTTMGSNGTAQAINDNATTTSTIVIAGAGAYLWDVDALTAITHTFPGDIDMTLTSPAGTIVTLTSDNVGSSDNVFNGTTWDDDANPGGAIPHAING